MYKFTGYTKGKNNTCEHRMILTVLQLKRGVATYFIKLPTAPPPPAIK